MNTASFTTEAIQQAIAQGAITEAYQADPQQVIQELNQLRATEVTSYLQYKQHAYMAVSLFAPGLKNDFEAHATLELHHADLLAQRIQQLGGVPLYSPVEIAAQVAAGGDDTAHREPLVEPLLHHLHRLEEPGHPVQGVELDSRSTKAARAPCGRRSSTCSAKGSSTAASGS